MYGQHDAKHTDKILSSVFRPDKNETTSEPVEPIILRSWERCVTHYNLEPRDERETRILDHQELLDHTTPIDEFIHIAKSGLVELYKQVNPLNYVILLADNKGVTVEYIGDKAFDKELKKSGLYLGSDWSEMYTGTNGVGVCASEGRSLTVHQGEHFDLMHTSLSCSAAPIFDPKGELLAVLDVSALSSPTNKDSQFLLLQMVRQHSLAIENANFLYHYRKNAWVIRFGALQEYVSINAPHMIAIDDTGKILGLNSSARLFFDPSTHSHDKIWYNAVGKNINHYFDCELDEFLCNKSEPSVNPTKATRIKCLGEKVYFSSTSPTEYKVSYSAGKPNSPSSSLAKESKDITLSLSQLSDTDPAMKRSAKLAKRLLNSGINFLLQGETGSGKEVFAKAIHNDSQRRAEPFVAVNCAAIPESLIESELFGYKAGSFTGASSKGMKGLIQQSSGGTLFLDEIADMPLQLQTRLLRVLAEQEVTPVGSFSAVPVVLNVISASHNHIETMVHEGTFREDLYFRLVGATLILPPLRERNDIESIIKSILKSENGGQDIQVEPDVMQTLRMYSWPGNVRELNNILRVTYAFSDGSKVTQSDLPDEFLRKLSDTSHQFQPRTSLSDTSIETGNVKYSSKVDRLIASLRKNKWNITDTAQELGISRATIYRNMKKNNIVPPNNLGF